MRARLSLGLSVAAAAWLSLAPSAFAGGLSTPNGQLNYSAQTVLLAPGANQVAIIATNLNYSTVGAGIPAATGVTVTFRAPAGDTFAYSGAAATGCVWFPGAVANALSPVANSLQCTVPGAGGPYTFLQLANPGGTGNVTLTGPDVANLGNNVYPGLAPLNGTAPSAVVPITAQATSGGAFTGDPTPLPNLALDSHNSFSLVAIPTTLGIDLTGNGLPAIPPGGGFVTNLADGTKGVARAGFLGTLWVNEAQNDLDARTGLNGIAGSPVSGNTNSAAAVTGTVLVALTGDFATLTGAYLVPNNNGVPSASQATCPTTPPANAIIGAVNAAKRAIAFPTFQTPANSGGNSPQPVFAVCLITNGTQVIQPTVAVPNGIQLDVRVTVTGIATAFVLTPAQGQTFGTITYEGSVFFAENVFGTATGARTFFRAVNQSNTPAQIWAVLTKDVVNQVPETGQGSCNDPGGITATCNISFVANLTSPTIPTNSATSAGLVQANTATYYVSDDIAALAGTTLPGSSLGATVRLLSPNTGMAFSALTQSTVFGVLVQTP